MELIGECRLCRRRSTKPPAMKRNSAPLDIEVSVRDTFEPLILTEVKRPVEVGDSHLAADAHAKFSQSLIEPNRSWRRRPNRAGSGRCQVCGGEFATYAGGFFPKVAEHRGTKLQEAASCGGSHARPFPDGIERLRSAPTSETGTPDMKVRLLDWRYQDGARIQVRPFLPFLDRPNFDCRVHAEKLLDCYGQQPELNEAGIEISDWLEEFTSATIVFTPGARAGTTDLFFAWPVDAVAFELLWGGDWTNGQRG